jgi:hypothetical protein
VSQPILMITAISGADNCAANLARQFGTTVEIAGTRKAGLSLLRRNEYSIVVVDDSMAESDPAGAELLWKHAGLAVPLQINFAISGPARVVREVRAALHRREQEQGLAMRAAANSIECELKSTVTGLLLQSQLALAEPAIAAPLAAKLRLMVELAGSLRGQLDRARA